MNACSAWLLLVLLVVGLLCRTAFSSKQNQSSAEQLHALRQSLQIQYDDADLEAFHDNNDINNDYASYFLDGQLGKRLQKRLSKLFNQTKTPSCRRKIVQHLSYFVNAIASEQPLPFADYPMKNTCNENRLYRLGQFARRHFHW